VGGLVRVADLTRRASSSWRRARGALRVSRATPSVRLLDGIVDELQRHNDPAAISTTAKHVRSGYRGWTALASMSPESYRWRDTAPSPYRPRCAWITSSTAEFSRTNWRRTVRLGWIGKCALLVTRSRAARPFSTD